MIIWLASFPRSGNTMLRIALHSVYGRSSYSLYEERPGEGGRENIASVMGSAGQVRDLDELRRRPEPCFVKTHDLPRDDSPAVCLIRDGRDVLVSYAHFVRTYEPAMAEDRSFDEVLRILIESRDHFGGWSGNVRAWYERPGVGRTVWLRYEDLVREPLGLLEAAARQVGVELRATGSPPVGFADLHHRWPEFFRRGTVGAWREEMSEALQRLFWQHHHEPMHWFGYRDREGQACRTS
jgi:sulfotransferase family protein